MRINGELTLSGPVPAAEIPSVYDTTLGAYAVSRHMAITHDLLEKGQIAADALESIEIQRTRYDPDTMRPIDRGLDFIFGKRPISDAEMNFVDVVQAAAPTDAWTMPRDIYEELYQDENEYDLMRNSALHTVRFRLAKFNDDQKGQLERHAYKNASLYNSQAAEAYSMNLSWFDWLTRTPDDSDAEAVLADRSLMNFLEWHVGYFAAIQSSDELAEAVDGARQKFKTGIKKGLRTKHLSEYAENALEKVDNVEVFVCDPFDPEIQGGASGYHQIGTEHVVIGTQWYDTTPEAAAGNASADLPHEISHAALATYWPEYVIWTGEGTTETVAQAIDDGVFGQANPETRNRLRLRESGIYDQHRRLQYTMRNGPHRIVPPALETRAYSGTAEEKQEFSDALDVSWGVKDVLKKVNIELNETAARIMWARPSGSRREVEAAALKEVRRRIRTTKRI